MKAQILMAVVAVLVVCTACSPAGAAAPVATPTLVPIPTLEATPDPLWAGTSVDLGANLGVCLTDATHFETRLLTGPIVFAKLNWITLADGIQTHTIEVEGARKEEVGYEVFILDSQKDLTKFNRVYIYIAVGNREWEFGYPVAYCRSQNP